MFSGVALTGSDGQHEAYCFDFENGLSLFKNRICILFGSCLVCVYRVMVGTREVWGEREKRSALGAADSTEFYLLQCSGHNSSFWIKDFQLAASNQLVPVACQVKRKSDTSTTAAAGFLSNYDICKVIHKQLAIGCKRQKLKLKLKHRDKAKKVTLR